MIIDKVTIKNFRGFDNKTLDFEPGINELVKDNEWGKTSITDAIRLAITDERIKPRDVRIGSSDEPEISLTLLDNGTSINFEAKGTALKPKKDRERIGEHLGPDYNYVVDTLLVVKHGELDEFQVNRNFMERMLKLDNISSYSSKISGMFTQKGEISRSKLGAYNELIASIEELEDEILELEEKLSRSNKSRKELLTLREKLKKLESTSKALEDTEKVLKLLIEKADIDESDEKRKELQKKIKDAEAKKEELTGKLEKVENDAREMKKSLKKGDATALNSLYKKRGKLAGEIEKLEKTLAETGTLKKRKQALKEKTGGYTLKGLENDKNRWEKAKTRLEAGNKVGLRATIKGKTSVDVNGKKMESGKEMECTDRATVKVGTTVLLDVWAGDKGMAKDSDLVDGFTEKYGSLSRLDQLISACRELGEVEKKLKDILGDLSVKDVTSNKDAMKKEIAGMDKSISEMEKVQKSQEKIRETLDRLNTHKTRYDERIKTLVSNLKEYRSAAAAVKPVDKNRVDGINKKIEGLPYGTVKKFKDMDSSRLKDEYDKTRNENKEKLESIIAVKDDMARVQDQVADVSEEELEKRRASLGQLIEKKKKADEYLDVIRGLHLVFPRLENALHEEGFTDIEEKTLEYFKKITRNSFKDLSIGNDGTRETYSLTSSSDVELDNYKCLSDGTRDQLFFAIRFAMIHLFAGPWPRFLVLDEPFAHTDISREKKIREILDLFVNDGWQVILFSCRE